MGEKKILEFLLNGKYFFIACSLIVTCFFITEFLGRFKIIGALSFLGVILLIIDLYKSKLYTQPFVIILALFSLITGIGVFLYSFMYNFA